MPINMRIAMVSIVLSDLCSCFLGAGVDKAAVNIIVASSSLFFTPLLTGRSSLALGLNVMMLLILVHTRGIDLVHDNMPMLPRSTQ
jgi:hypothetical protein